MNPRDNTGTPFAGRSLDAQLTSLRELYARIEAEQAESLAAIAAAGVELSCPPDCGSCCEGFIPDLLPVEARYLADWLLRERPDLAERAHSWAGDAPRKPPCPFHESGRSGGHCGVYHARPLICRLFGFASVRDREGRPSYALCRLMPSRSGGRSWAGADIESELGAHLPDMAAFGSLAGALVPEETGSRSLLTAALPAALGHLSLILRFSRLEDQDCEEPDGDDEPNPSTPAPRAA
jgi:Fe-S-cluster containining protein